jgi:L,D-transpeptidase catalytic domain
MKLVRFTAIAVFAILALSWFSNTPYWKKARTVHSTTRTAPHVLATYSPKKLQQKAAEARTFVQQKKYNDNICFLIDMTLASGQNRFFIYDLKKDTVQAAGLVAHGNCFQYWLEGRTYSNVVGSGCTSLGKYKIGNSYIGKWGYSYKLHGLDSTNNNAFERTVVLHSHSCVSETEITDEICQSNGCPTVSPGFLQQLKAIINKSDKPVLLWIYE